MSEVERFELWQSACGDSVMEPNADGDWVTHVDHAQIVAAKDAEIARLRAEVDRVRAQRDRLAVDVHNTAKIFAQMGGRVCPKLEADDTLAKHGLRIEGGEVKEIEG